MNTIDKFIQEMRFSDGKLPLTEYWQVFFGMFAYLVVVFGIQESMRNRKAFDLKKAVAVHNFILCGISILMFVGITFELIRYSINISRKGNSAVEALFCDSHHQLVRGPLIGWFYIFYLSKYYEYGDTLFLVLKKKPLIFLHVYHHCTTALLVFVNLDFEAAMQWCPIAANSFVHIPMYYYYGMSSLGYRVWWKKYITVIQIVQFVTSLTVFSIPFGYLIQGRKCSGAISWLFSFAILLSFLILFLSFYRKTYKEEPGEVKKEN